MYIYIYIYTKARHVVITTQTMMMECETTVEKKENGHDMTTTMTTTDLESKTCTMSSSNVETIVSPRKRKGRTMVRVRVPATSANLGPGFDCIGMAVDIWNELKAEVVVDDDDDVCDFVITAEGSGAKDMPQGDKSKDNLVYLGMKAAYEAAGTKMPKLRCHCINRIPFARGLGSSSAAIVGGIIAGLALSGHELNVWGDIVQSAGARPRKHAVKGEEILQIAAGIEGHPDNVAPALYGGIQLGIHTSTSGDSKDGRWLSARVPVPEGVQLIIFVPDQQFETKTARKLLPSTYDPKEVVFNVGRAAFLVNALNKGEFRDLYFGTQDAMHQPYRATVLKHLNPLIEAAIDAGAHGCYLSGAGPTVLAITSGAAGDIFTQRAEERCEIAVADAMRRTAEARSVKGKVYITSPSIRGAHIVEAKPPFSEGVVEYPGAI